MSFFNQRIPTTDLYFANACMPWASKSQNFRCEGPNSFSNENAIIICRREKKRVVRRLLKQRSKVIYYIIDDNLWDIDNINTIPFDYKQKLIDLRDGQHAEIINMAEAVIVPSEILQEKYRERGYNAVRVNPYWSEKIPDSWNFANPNRHCPLKIGYLGTTSHIADRNFVIQVYQGLLESCTDVELTIFGINGVDKKLLKEKKIKIQNYTNWKSYRSLIQNLKLDIILYPILPSKFNDARSMSKIIEHAVSGGLGVYSDTWQYADVVNSNRIGLTWPNNVDSWIEKLTLLARTQNFQEKIGNITHIKLINDKARSDQINFWSNAILK